MRTTTLTIAFATVMTVATAVPVLAANDQGRATSAQVRHSMTTRHQHHANLQPRGSNAMMPRGTANANGSFANANASADKPLKEESMASQLAKTVTVTGNASSPTCQPGTMTPLDDGRMHPCQ